jgi:hypothetical protein
MKLTGNQEEILRHMLGAEKGRYPMRNWGFRNHYACSEFNDDKLEELCDMVDQGLLSKGGRGHELIYFHATELGCRAVGLTNKQIKNALE